MASLTLQASGTIAGPVWDLGATATAVDDCTIGSGKAGTLSGVETFDCNSLAVVGSLAQSGGTSRLCTNYAPTDTQLALNVTGTVSVTGGTMLVRGAVDFTGTSGTTGQFSWIGGGTVTPDTNDGARNYQWRAGTSNTLTPSARFIVRGPTSSASPMDATIPGNYLVCAVNGPGLAHFDVPITSGVGQYDCEGVKFVRWQNPSTKVAFPSRHTAAASAGIVQYHRFYRCWFDQCGGTSYATSGTDRDQIVWEDSAWTNSPSGSRNLSLVALSADNAAGLRRLAGCSFDKAPSLQTLRSFEFGRVGSTPLPNIWANGLAPDGTFGPNVLPADTANLGWAGEAHCWIKRDRRHSAETSGSLTTMGSLGNRTVLYFSATSAAQWGNPHGFLQGNNCLVQTVDGALFESSYCQGGAIGDAVLTPAGAGGPPSPTDLTLQRIIVSRDLNGFDAMVPLTMTGEANTTARVRHCTYPSSSVNRGISIAENGSGGHAGAIEYADNNLALASDAGNPGCIICDFPAISAVDGFVANARSNAVNYALSVFGGRDIPQPGYVADAGHAACYGASCGLTDTRDPQVGTGVDLGPQLHKWAYSLGRTPSADAVDDMDFAWAERAKRGTTAWDPAYNADAFNVFATNARKPTWDGLRNKVFAGTALYQNPGAVEMDVPVGGGGGGALPSGRRQRLLRVLRASGGKVGARRGRP